MAKDKKVQAPVKQSIAMQVASLEAKVDTLTTAVKQLIPVKDGRHEALLGKIKEVSDKLGV